MPIFIKMTNDQEFQVSGEQTLQEFMTQYVEIAGDYLKIDVKSRGTLPSVPTVLVKENVISIQEKPERKARAIQKPAGL